jgi:hypothetical protein
MAKNENPLAKYEKTTDAVEQLSAEARELYHAKIDAIRSMNEDLRQQYDEMLDTAEVQFKETLDFYYALGNKLWSIETSNEETYGPAPIDKLVAAWSIGESLIYKCLDFAQQYTQSEFDALREIGISWTHTTTLLAIHDKTVREELQQRVGQENLSTRELGKLVKDMNTADQRPANSPGRAYQQPRTIAAGLDQMTTVCEKWERQNASVWAGEDDSVLASLEAMPTEEYSDQIAEKLDQVIITMERLAALATANASRGNRIRETVNEALDPQADDEEDNSTEETDETQEATSVARRALRRARRNQ